jgi:hypothetical protein
MRGSGRVRALEGDSVVVSETCLLHPSHPIVARLSTKEYGNVVKLSFPTACRFQMHPLWSQYDNLMSYGSPLPKLYA